MIPQIGVPLILHYGRACLRLYFFQALGQAIDQHLHKRKFPLMKAERPVAYINRCPDWSKSFLIHYCV